MVSAEGSDFGSTGWLLNH